MAVHAQYAFPHDPRAIATRSALDNAMSASAFLGEPGGGGGHPLAAGNAAFGDLTRIFNNDSGCVAPPAKRARVGDAAGAGLFAGLQQGHRALLPPVPAPQAFAAAGDDARGRLLCSAAASTCGRATPSASQGLLLSHVLYRHGVETDALIRVENERLRAALQEARRRHVAAAVSLVERAAARRLRAAEAELGRAAARNAELEEWLRQVADEGRAWRDVARGHETVAAGLRAALEDLAPRRSPPRNAGAGGEGDAEDAESCCFEFEARQEEGATGATRAACRSCGGEEACVLVLPCRHLCLCGVCEAAAEACPVCAAAKNASLHVLLS